MRFLPETLVANPFPHPPPLTISLLILEALDLFEKSLLNFMYSKLPISSSVIFSSPCLVRNSSPAHRPEKQFIPFLP